MELYALCDHVLSSPDPCQLWFVTGEASHIPDVYRTVLFSLFHIGREGIALEATWIEGGIDGRK